MLQSWWNHCVLFYSLTMGMRSYHFLSQRSFFHRSSNALACCSSNVTFSIIMRPPLQENNLLLAPKLWISELKNTHVIKFSPSKLACFIHWSIIIIIIYLTFLNSVSFWSFAFSENWHAICALCFFFFPGGGGGDSEGPEGNRGEMDGA